MGHRAKTVPVPKARCRKPWGVCWEGRPRLEHLPALRRDLRQLRDSGLRYPSQLIFHHVFLGPKKTGPSLFVFGKKGDRNVHVRYLPRTVWVSAMGGKRNG